MGIIIGVIVLIFLFVCSLLLTEQILEDDKGLRQNKIKSRLARLSMEHLVNAYIPPCDICSGRGVVFERQGSMVHISNKTPCSCRCAENWLLALADKWIEEGDVQHATELLLVLKERI